MLGVARKNFPSGRKILYLPETGTRHGCGLPPGKSNPNATVRIGRAYEGQIDELTFYNSALTSTEINDIVTADSFGKCRP